MARHWTLDDIPWDRFDPNKVDPEMLRIVKAAAMVEYNANDYARYLCNVFHDDAEFSQAAQDWAVEEVQHGQALGRWAEIADPTFRFEESFAEFRRGFRIETDADASVRGSRSGELIARCMVETGTSSYYSALGDATEEPALKMICRKIAADELRHYKLFYDHLKRYIAKEQLSRLRRLWVALSRIAETEDDELSYAYYAANKAGEPYDRKRHNREYMSRAFSYYRLTHVDRVTGMIFKACGLKPRTHLFGIARWIMWRLVEARSRRMAAAAGVPAAA